MGAKVVLNAQNTLIAHLYDRKLAALRARQPLPPKIRALIIYPTRALANDQAKRITEILY